MAPAPSPGGTGIGDEHQRKPARRHEQCRKPFHRTLVHDLLLTVMRMMRRCHGCLDTVKRVNTARRGNTVAMMHYLWIVKSRGN